LTIAILKYAKIKGNKGGTY